jgi:hypothetical protein
MAWWRRDGAEDRALTRENLHASMLAPAGASSAVVTPRTAMAAVDVLACVQWDRSRSSR